MLNKKDALLSILVTMVSMLVVMVIGVIIGGGVALVIGMALGTLPINLITIAGTVLFFGVGGFASVMYSNFICRGNCFKFRD